MGKTDSTHLPTSNILEVPSGVPEYTQALAKSQLPVGANAIVITIYCLPENVSSTMFRTYKNVGCSEANKFKATQG